MSNNKPAPAGDAGVRRTRVRLATDASLHDIWLRVSCPECGAHAGLQCNEPTQPWVVFTNVHLARLELYQWEMSLTRPPRRRRPRGRRRS